MNAPRAGSDFERAFAEWVLRHRIAVITVSLLVALAATSGLPRLEVDDDLRVFFGDDNPELRDLEALENAYTKSDNVIFVLAPRDGRVFTPATLAVVAALTEDAWQLPHSNRVDSLSNFQRTTASGDEFTVAPLVSDPGSLTPERAAAIGRAALAEPLLAGRLVSTKGDVTAVNVKAADLGHPSFPSAARGSYPPDTAGSGTIVGCPRLIGR